MNAADCVNSVNSVSSANSVNSANSLPQHIALFGELTIVI